MRMTLLPPSAFNRRASRRWSTSPDSVLRAISYALLEKLGWLRIDSLVGSERVTPCEELFEFYDTAWMGWDVAQDGITVAKIAAATDDAQTVPDLAGQLGRPARRMNPALQYLISRGAVEESECGAPPFLTHWIRRNENTAAFAAKGA